MATARYSDEALAVRKAMTDDPRFRSLPVEQQRSALQDWKAKYEAPKTVTVSKEPARLDPQQVKQANPAAVRKPLLPAEVPLPQRPRTAGPVAANPATPGPVGNALLKGYANLQAVQAPASQGRPILPPEMEQAINPVTDDRLKVLSEGLPLVEQIAPRIAMGATPLGLAGPLLTDAAMRGAQYGAAVSTGQLDRDTAQSQYGADLLTNVAQLPLGMALPGNSLLNAATRNLAQGEGQATLDELLTGRRQSGGDVLVNSALGAGLDLAMGRTPQLPDMAPVKRAVNDLVAPPRMAASQRGSATADDASFGGVFRKGDEPPSGGRIDQTTPVTPEDAPADPTMAPPTPPVTPPPAGPAAPPPDPQRGPVTFEIVGPAAQASGGAGGQPPPPPPPHGNTPPPPPPPHDPAAPVPLAGQFPDPKPTPEMQRVYGDDANNLRGEARQVIKDVARVMDNAPRPDVDPARVAEVREIIDANVNYKNGMIRTDKLSGMSDAARNNLLTRAAEVAVEEGLDPKARIGFDVIRQRAAAISPEVLRDLQPPKKGETIDPALWRAASEQIDANSKQIVHLEQMILDGQRIGTDPAMVRQMQDALSVLENDTKRLLAVTLPTRSQNGRNLAYHRIVNQGSFTTEYWTGRALKAAGLKSVDDLPDSVRDKVRDLTLKGRNAQDAGDTEGADAARIELAKLLAGLEKTSPLSAFVNTIRAGLLSAPTTHGINLTGNTLNLMVEGAARVPASIADSFLGMFTGRRTVQGLNAAAIVDAGKNVRTNGWREFKEILRNGATLDDLKRFELPREQNTGSRVLDAYVNGSFRLLGAEDRLFRSYAVRRSLSEQADLLARQAAKDAGKAAKANGDPFDARDFYQTKRQELIDKPTDAMQAQAIGDAEYATFQGDNLLASLVSGSKKGVTMTGQAIDKANTERTGQSSRIGAVGAEAVNTGVDLTMPFVKTPSNVVMNLLDLTGIGGAIRGVGGVANRVAVGRENKAVMRELVRALNPAEQRAIAQAVGRGAIGWAIMALGGYLQQKGILTGKYDKNEKGLKGTNQLADMQEGALNIGGRSIGIARLTPPGALLTLGATLMQDGGDIGNVGTQALSIVSEMPMMQGAKQLSDAIDNPAAMGSRMASNYAGMVVPNLINKVGAMTDSVERQAYDQNASTLSNMGRAIAARLPGLRQTLPAKTDPFGRSIPQNRAAIVDFTNSRAINQDPMVQELRRAGVEVRQPKPEQKIRDEYTDEERTVKLTPAQMQQVKATTGALARVELEDYLASDDCREASPTERKTEIEKIIAFAQKEARSLLEEQINNGYPPDPGVYVPHNTEAAGAAFWGSNQKP